MRRSGMWLAILCAAAILPWAAPAIAVDTKQAQADAADDFFGPDKFYALHIHLTEEAWQLMQPTRRARPMALIADSTPDPATRTVRKGATTRATIQTVAQANKIPPISGEKLPPNNFGWEYVYVKAAFECNGEVLRDVAVRFKGNSSYDNFNRSLRRPFKVDFDRFAAGRKFRGLGAVNLANNAFDTSQLRESLSYEVYRRAGVPAPRTALATVHLTVDGRHDRAYVGVYTISEELDEKPFLKRNFGDAGGILLKPEAIRGLPYMGETWAPYAGQYRSKTNAVDPLLARRFIELVKLVNYADDATFRAKVGDYLAIDEFLRYVAASTLISNLDSALVTNHNYYLYANPRDGRVSIMPWDMNLSFAGYGTPGPRDDQVNLSIAHPWAGQIKLFDRVMAIEENQRAYRAHLRRFVEDFFNERTMHGLIDTMQGALREADKAALAARMPAVSEELPSAGAFGRSRYTLRQYVTLRTQSVLDQLDGKDVATFEPRPNPPGMVFEWGLNAPPEFGVLPRMARAVRQQADADGDFGLSAREARDAVAALFFRVVNEENPEALVPRELRDGLNPLISEFSNGGRSRGFFGLGGGNSDAAMAWARVIFRDADTDGDLKVTLEELTAMVDRTFCLADRDQDGRLDEREVLEGFDLVAAQDTRARGR